MRKQTALVVAAIMTLIGLVFIAAPQAQAADVTGISTLNFHCAGNGGTDTSFTYSLTQTGTSGTSPNHTINYTFQMLSSTYHGLSPFAGRGPTFAITFGGHEAGLDLFISSGFGGASGINNQVWPRYAAANNVTLTDGINVDWTPQSISVTPWKQGNTWGRFEMNGQSACTQIVDLGFPDAPNGLAGTSTLAMTCDTSEGLFPNDPAWQDHLTLKYDILNTTGNHYTIHVKEATWENGVSPYTFSAIDPSEIALILDGARNQDGLILDSGTPNWTRAGTPPPNTFHELQGLPGVNFPTIGFDYQPGDNPVIVSQFTRTHLGGDVTCESETPLANVWNSGPINSDPAFEDVALDDCSGIPASVNIKPIWERTSNGNAYRLTSFSFKQTNGSGAKVVLDAGTSTVLGGVTLSEQSGINPTNLTTINSSISLADRTITSGETQVFPVDTGSKWTRVSAPSDHSAAPSSFVIGSNLHPTLTVRAKVYNSVGILCPPSNPGASGDISELSYQPND